MEKPGVGEMRRTALIAAVVVAAFAGWGTASADGPGGSSEHHAECTDPESGSTFVGPPGSTAEDCPEGTEGETVHDNNVTCGDNTEVAGLDVFFGPGGFEVCNDDTDIPIQGRVMVSEPLTPTGYAGADGDRDNIFPADGWIGFAGAANGGLACGHREAGAPTSSLDHANENDDFGDCAGL